MAEVKLNLGNKIRILREIKGLSQENMARSLAISQQAYQKIEDGSTKVSIERAQQISQELGMELDSLLNFNPSTYLFNCTQSAGFINEINNNYFGKDELIEKYEKQLAELKAELEKLKHK